MMLIMSSPLDRFGTALDQLNARFYSPRRDSSPDTTPPKEKKRSAGITMHQPTTGKKPSTRARITEMWQEANASGRVRVTPLRASDFYGPSVTNAALGEMVAGAAVAGKPARPQDLRTSVHLDKVYRIKVYLTRMSIQGFARPAIQRFFVDGTVPRRAGWAGVATIAARKLDLLDYAHALADLRSPPGNMLKALKGDLAGYHSIRINDQWRVVFRWTVSGPTEVDIQDYH
jgi:proteic killer suppression protein